MNDEKLVVARKEVEAYVAWSNWYKRRYRTFFVWESER